jgi:cell division protein FtsB
VKDFPKISRFPRAEDKFRSVVERAPQAEAIAASWIARMRPMFTGFYLMRRRIATLAVAVLAGWLFIHVMFGVNGMVVYKQKRAESLALHKQIAQVQQENDRYTQQVQGLKSDKKAIEKEAREQLGYAMPGEYVYVPTPAVKPVVPANHTAKK